MKGSNYKKYNKITCLLVLTLCALLASSCGLNTLYIPATSPDASLKCPSQDCLKQALVFKQNGQPEQADATLRAIRTDYPDTIWSARASYLLGIAAIEDGKASQAVPLFIEAIKLPAIEDRVLFNLSHAYAADGQQTLAAAILDSIIILYPDSVLTKSVKYRRAEAFFDAGSYEQARDAFYEFSNTYPDDTLADAALTASARASILLGEPQAAILPLQRLYVHYPAFNRSASVAAEVDALIAALKSVGILMPRLTIDEGVLRADALFKAQLWEEAAAAYKGLSSPQWRSTAVLRSAEAMQHLKRYAASEEILSNYLNNGPPESSTKPRALRLLVTALIRQDKSAALRRIIQGKTLRNLAPSNPLAEAKLAAARYFDDRGDDKTAMSLYTGLLETYADSMPGREAAWSIGWRRYRDGQYKEAVRFFSSACAQESGRCLYWSGRACEKAGLVDTAIDYYQKTCSISGTSYYCMLASKRAPAAVKGRLIEPLQGLLPVVEESERTRLTLSTDRHYLAAAELSLLGLTKQAAEELDLITKLYSRDNGAVLALAKLFYENGDIYRGLRTWRLYLSDTPGSQPYTLPMTYPAQAVKLARDCSNAQLTDPYLVASIMREESAFNPEAVSRAGAMGIMQLMPSTARFIAEKTAAPDFKRDELLISRINIRLGSSYLDYLVGSFNGNIIQAIAAYNAGPGAVKIWTQKYPNEPDEFIESIPYPETRAYTKRVIETYNLYLRLSETIPKDVSALISFNNK